MRPIESCLMPVSGAVVALLCTVAHSDALAVLSAARTISSADRIESPGDAPVSQSPLSLDIRFGLGLVSDTDSIVSEAYDYIAPATVVVGRPVTLSEISTKWDPGISLNIGVSYEVMEKLRVGVEIGFSQNDLDSMSGDYRVDSVLGPETIASVSISEGRLVQMPLLGLLRYEWELVPSLSFGLSAGAGVQFSWAEVSGGTITSVAPAVLPGADLDVGVDGRSVAFRYQGGLDLSWQIAPSTQLGFSAGFAGSSRSNFGDGLALTVYNVVLGGRLSFSF